MADEPVAEGDELELVVGKMRSAAALPFRGTLNKIYEQFRGVRDGKVADYIPELAKANPGTGSESVS